MKKRISKTPFIDDQSRIARTIYHRLRTLRLKRRSVEESAEMATLERMAAQCVKRINGSAPDETGAYIKTEPLTHHSRFMNYPVSRDIMVSYEHLFSAGGYCFIASNQVMGSASRESDLPRPAVYMRKGDDIVLADFSESQTRRDLLLDNIQLGNFTQEQLDGHWNDSIAS